MNRDEAFKGEVVESRRRGKEQASRERSVVSGWWIANRIEES